MVALPQIVRDLYIKHGYTLFDGGYSYNLNIFGVRSADYAAGTFNDRIGCLYRDTTGQQRVDLWVGTTDPGIIYRRQPRNARGAAILAPAQNLSCWQLGSYKNREALVQVGPIAVYRDNDRDDRLDPAGGVEQARSGLHLHYMGQDTSEDRLVDRWSAGCQGIRNPRDFAALLALAHEQIRVHPTWTRFTYTLFEAKVDREAITLLTAPI